MEFRWAAGIALWTLLSGPVFVGVQQIVPRAPASKGPCPVASTRTTDKAPTLRPGPR
jgi:hypothetical protein